jgi:hypothetical protein
MAIGLAHSRGVVESMGGSVGIERTATGEGSLCFVELPPIGRPARAHVTAFRSHHALGLEDEPLATTIVLYLNEDPTNLELVRRVLARAGNIDVIPATRG